MVNVLWVIVVIYLICYLIFAKLTKKFFKTIFLTGFIGIGLLILIRLFGSYIGVFIPINIYTVTVSGLAGLPGVILLLLFNIIFI